MQIILQKNVRNIIIGKMKNNECSIGGSGLAYRISFTQSLEVSKIIQ